MEFMNKFLNSQGEIRTDLSAHHFSGFEDESIMKAGLRMCSEPSERVVTDNHEKHNLSDLLSVRTFSSVEVLPQNSRNVINIIDKFEVPEHPSPKLKKPITNRIEETSGVEEPISDDFEKKLSPVSKISEDESMKSGLESKGRLSLDNRTSIESLLKLRNSLENYLGKDFFENRAQEQKLTHESPQQPGRYSLGGDTSNPEYDSQVFADILRDSVKLK